MLLFARVFQTVTRARACASHPHCGTCSNGSGQGDCFGAVSASTSKKYRLTDLALLVSIEILASTNKAKLFGAVRSEKSIFPMKCGRHCSEFCSDRCSYPIVHGMLGLCRNRHRVC